jgi:dihydrofolate synthase/folylpolyglutamate synthase
MTYPEALDYLASLQRFGMRPGLERTRWLATRLGEPHHGLSFIHVAGTNGKGSVCAFLEAIHRAQGRRVGLFTSPHLISFTERVQINRERIPTSAVANWIERIRQTMAAAGPDIDTAFTFFEVVSVMALAYFAEEKCDLVIWETGLGGRLDATNIVTPLASVITNIDFDHRQWLGHSLDEIAAEKAGIIKPGRPVITAAQPGRGLEVIMETSRRLDCPLTVVTPAISPGQGTASGAPRPHEARVSVWSEGEAWSNATGENGTARPTPGLRGAHQRLNAAVAVATTAALADVVPVAPEALRAGVVTADWPGRMQLMRGATGPAILLDGAHNPGSALALREALAAEFPGVRPLLILGVLADKDWQPLVESLAPLASQIRIVPVSSNRNLAPDILLEACRRAHPDPNTPIIACASLAKALPLSWASLASPSPASLASGVVEEDQLVVITGSLYLVGEALELLRGGTADSPSERNLNEWGGVPVPPKI